MQDGERLSLEQIQAFLEASDEIRFNASDRLELYEWMERTLVEQEYAGLGRASKGLVRRYGIADTESEDSYQITGGISTEGTVAVSSDGRRIIYSEEKYDLDITTVSLLDVKSTKLIASAIFDRIAAWTSGPDKLASATHRNGPLYTWLLC